jgi:hypothetical protein
MMRKTICIFQLVLLGCSLALAQNDKKQSLQNRNKPDLNGTWIRDSKPGEPRQSNDSAIGEVKLIIVQQEPEIRITRHIRNSEGQSIVESRYYSDGRGELNKRPGLTLESGDTENKGLASKTKWNIDKLVTQAAISDANYRSGWSIRITEEWNLSKESKVLMQTTTYEFGLLKGETVSPAKPRVYKKVYHLAP